MVFWCSQGQELRDCALLPNVSLLFQIDLLVAALLNCLLLGDSDPGAIQIIG
jgi:hypothetical protein